jgi:hypothetical protein
MQSHTSPSSALNLSYTTAINGTGFKRPPSKMETQPGRLI